MEIILREDVQHLGKAGEMVKVKDGYARNYLLPKGLAYVATEGNRKRITFEAERIARMRATEKQAAEGEAAKLAGLSLTFPMKVGEEDKLYGSVTASDIQRRLEEQGDPRGQTKDRSGRADPGSWANSAWASSSTPRSGRRSPWWW